MEGPRQRLPPNVVVSDLGQVTTEEGATAWLSGGVGRGAAVRGGGTFVGADGRPMTGAVGHRTHIMSGGGRGEGGEEEEEGVVGQLLAMRMTSNWGDPDAIGLAGERMISRCGEKN